MAYSPTVTAEPLHERPKTANIGDLHRNLDGIWSIWDGKEWFIIDPKLRERKVE